jgi:hypothetical protein
MHPELVGEEAFAGESWASDHNFPVARNQEAAITTRPHARLRLLLPLCKNAPAKNE